MSYVVAQQMLVTLLKSLRKSNVDVINLFAFDCDQDALALRAAAVSHLDTLTLHDASTRSSYGTQRRGIETSVKDLVRTHQRSTTLSQINCPNYSGNLFEKNMMFEKRSILTPVRI